MTALDLITKQQAYEQVREYFAREGAQLSKENPSRLSSCFYRHPEDGRKCAFGVLIPDEVYKENMENKTALAVLAQHSAFARWDEDTDLAAFLSKMQRKHDDSLDVEEFITKLDELAGTTGLTVA